MQVSPSAGSVLDVASWGPSLLVYTTQRGGLAAWDLRMSGDAWALPNHPDQVPMAAPAWVTAGTARRQHLTSARLQAAAAGPAS